LAIWQRIPLVECETRSQQHARNLKEEASGRDEKHTTPLAMLDAVDDDSRRPLVAITRKEEAGESTDPHDTSSMSAEKEFFPHDTSSMSAEKEFFPRDTSPLSAERYFSQRLVPQLKRCRTEAPRLSRRLKIYEFLVVISSLAGTLLGAFHAIEFIPIFVSFGALVTSCMEYENLRGRLSAINMAVSELTAISMHWHNLVAVQKGTRSEKRLLVEVTEAAVMREAAALVAGAAQVASDFSDPSKKAGEKDDTREKEDK